MFAFALTLAAVNAGCGGAQTGALAVPAGPESPRASDSLQATALAGSWSQALAVAAGGASHLVGGSQVLAPDQATATARGGPGQISWSASGPAPTSVTCSALYADGGAVVGGRFVRELGPLRAEGDSAGFVARLGPDGTATWTAALSSFGYAHVRAVTAAEDGGAVAVGYFRREVAIEGAHLQRSAGSHDAIVVRFAADGQVRWVRRLGGPGPDYAHAVGVAPDGDVVVAGSFAGPVDFGDQTHQSINNSSDAFVARLAGDDGATKWSTRLGSGFDDAIFGVAVTSGADIAVTGLFASTGLLGGAPVESRGGDDVFVALLDATGAQRWQRTLGSGGDDEVAGIALAGSQLVVAGSFPAPLYIADGTDPRLAPAGDRDAYLAAFTLDGDLADARSFGGEGLDAIAAVAAHGDTAYAVGSITGALKDGSVTATAGVTTPVLLTWRVAP